MTRRRLAPLLLNIRISATVTRSRFIIFPIRFTTRQGISCRIFMTTSTPRTCRFRTICMRNRATRAPIPQSSRLFHLTALPLCSTSLMSSRRTVQPSSSSILTETIISSALTSAKAATALSLSTQSRARHSILPHRSVWATPSSVG